MLSNRRSYPLALSVFLALVSLSAFAAENPDAVVAKQGSATVTLADIDAFTARIPEDKRAGFFNSPQRIETTIRNLLAQKQMADEARKAGIDRDPAMKQQLAMAVDETLAREALIRFKAGIKVPDMTELANEEYIAHKEKYVTPGELDVKHVLISTRAHTEDEANKIAADVEEQAKAHPDQFDALVEKYSEDTSKHDNGGLMKDAGSAKYAGPFAAAARALKKPNEISPVVKTSYGFHVLKLIKRTPDQQKTYAEVREEIAHKLHDDFIDKAMRDHTDIVRNQPLDADPDLVASLRSRYGAAMTPAEAAAGDSPAQ